MTDPVNTDALRYAAANSWKPLNGSDKALIAAAADELDELRAWKAEAVKVLAMWEEVWELLPPTYKEKPANLGRSKAELTKEWLLL